LVGAGGLNLLAGLSAKHLLALTTEKLPAYSQQVSLSMLGSGAQIIFGASLMIAGIGVVWRVRVAWIFALMLLTVTFAVDIAKHAALPTLIVPGLVFVSLIVYRHRFTRQTIIGNSIVSLLGIVAVMGYGTLGLLLLGQQFEPPIKTPLTAIYYLVETLTTTGFGDYHPVTPLAQGFLIGLWFFGLSVFGTALLSVAGPALSGRMRQFLNPGRAKRMETDHVILVGHGQIAVNAADEFVRRKIDFVQVVGENVEPPLNNYPVVHGDTSEDATLSKAGIASARMLIAAADDDGENAFISLAAKSINPGLKVMVVASSRRAIRRLKLARADLVFAPAEVGSRMMVNLVEGQDLPREFMDLLTVDTGA